MAWQGHDPYRELDSGGEVGSAWPASVTWGGRMQVEDRAQLLAAVSAAQLASGVAGMVIALRRRHPYDVFWMHGQAEQIARDTLFRGTALSAPVSNLILQAALTAVVTARPSRRAQQALGVLGGPVGGWVPG